MPSFTPFDVRQAVVSVNQLPKVFETAGFLYCLPRLPVVCNARLPSHIRCLPLFIDRLLGPATTPYTRAEPTEPLTLARPYSITTVIYDRCARRQRNASVYSVIVGNSRTVVTFRPSCIVSMMYAVIVCRSLRVVDRSQVETVQCCIVQWQREGVACYCHNRGRLRYRRAGVDLPTQRGMACSKSLAWFRLQFSGMRTGPA